MMEIAFLLFVLAGVGLIYALLSLRGRRRLKILSAGVLLVVAVMLGSKYNKGDNTLKIIESVRQTAETVSEEKLEEQITFLRTHGIVDSEIASSKFDVCTVHSLDAGWTVREWEQECSLWYVKGFVTRLDKNSVLEILRADPQSEPDQYDEPPASTNLFGELLSLYGMEIFKCQLARGAADTGISAAHPNEGWKSQNRKILTTLEFRPQGSKPEGSHCGIPTQYDKPIGLFEPSSVKVFGQFDSGLVGSGSNQIWLIQQHRYYYEDLGCGVGLMCPLPRSKPIQAP